MNSDEIKEEINDLYEEYDKKHMDCCYIMARISDLEDQLEEAIEKEHSPKEEEVEPTEEWEELDEDED